MSHSSHVLTLKKVPVGLRQVSQVMSVPELMLSWLREVRLTGVPHFSMILILRVVAWCSLCLSLVLLGRGVLSDMLSSYLRSHLSLAPEEFVQAVAQQLSSDEQLSNIGKHLGESMIVLSLYHLLWSLYVRDS